MNSNLATDRHRWLSKSSMMVAAKLATSLKPNWNIAKLGNIAEKISTGTTPPSQERRYYDGDIDWFTPSDIGGNRWLSAAKKTITNEAISEKKGRTFDAGTILITCIGHIGRVGILAKTSSANQQITGIKFDKTIDPEFAYYGLFARQDELQAAAPTASTLSILNQSRLSNIDFCFPSLDEQNQISKFLSWYEDRLVNSQLFTNDHPTLPDYLSHLPHIVEQVEALATRIAKAQFLREETLEDAGNLLIVMAHRSDKNRDELLKEGWEEVRLGEVIHQVKDRCRVELNTDYPNLGIYSYARGLFHKQPIDGNLTSAKELYRVHKGQFIYSRLFAFEGACGIVTDEYDGCFVSGEYPTFDCDPNRVNPEFLFAYFKSLDVWRTVSAGSKGLGDRRQRVQPEKFLEHKLLLPPLEWQSKITTMMKKIDDLQSIQSQTGEELDALLPSVLDKAFKGEL